MYFYRNFSLRKFFYGGDISIIIFFIYTVFIHSFKKQHINIYIYSNNNYLSGSSGYLIPIRYPDDPLRWNSSKLVPDSISNYRYFFALLSIEHFLHCSLVTLTVFFSFDQPIACLLIFFNWHDKVGLFFFFFFPIYIFFQYVYIFFYPWQWFVVYFHLQITCRVFFLP